MKTFKIVIRSLNKENAIYTIEAETLAKAIQKAKTSWNNSHDKYAPVDITWNEMDEVVKVQPKKPQLVEPRREFSKEKVIIPQYIYRTHEPSGIKVTFNGQVIELALEQEGE